MLQNIIPRNKNSYHDGNIVIPRTTTTCELTQVQANFPYVFLIIGLDHI